MIRNLRRKFALCLTLMLLFTMIPTSYAVEEESIEFALEKAGSITRREDIYSSLQKLTIELENQFESKELQAIDSAVSSKLNEYCNDLAMELNKAKKENRIPDFKKLYTESMSTERTVNIITNYMDKKTDLIINSDRVITDIKTNVSDFRVVSYPESNVYLCDFTIDTTIDYYLTDGSKPDVPEMTSIKYMLLLSFEKDEIKILKLTPLSTTFMLRQIECQKYLESSAEKLWNEIILDDVLAYTEKETNARIAERMSASFSAELSIDSVNDVSDTITPKAYPNIVAYDQTKREGAINYAFTYYQYYNSSFVNYQSYSGESYGGDCTNFVSQCLNLGGGMPLDTTGSGTYEHHYAWNRVYSGGLWRKATESWSGARQLSEYMLKNDVGTPKTGITASTGVSISTLEIGDVVFYSWPGSTAIHSVLVVGFLRNGTTKTDVLFSSHTNNEYGYRSSLKMNETGWTDSKVHIKGYY